MTEQIIAISSVQQYKNGIKNAKQPVVNLQHVAKSPYNNVKGKAALDPSKGISSSAKVQRS
jgi:hypothetical protein